ncbi:MAG TPA: ATP-binding protein, partial [Gaiellaceae bacterium]|nr:ATP-binding protein [Gaiellaceae bacterium]
GRLFGLPGDELAGKRFSDFTEPDVGIDAPLADLLDLGELEGEWTVVRPDGERRVTEYSLRANLAPGLHLAVLRDRTDAHGLEEQLRQAQKLEAVGQLAGGIAHDFNNLLTAIAGYSDLALDQLDSGGPGARTSVEEIRRASDRAAQLTQQLLAFSRQQVLKQEPLDLNIVVGEYMPMLTRILGEQITVVLALGSEPLTVSGDRGQLGQVIINLAVNARDAMPDGGTLTFRTLPGEGDPPTALLQVTDTGTGIDAATRARLFEPFFTTKPVGQGTGLGLATVLGIVEQSGGTVAVESQLGVGTTFTIALACIADTAVTTTTPPTASDANGSESILVVEDDASLGEMIKRMLDARGYAITLANTPVEALALSRAADGGAFELLVTDVVMPEMNGRQLAELLLADRPDLRVLYTSGYSEDDLLARGVIDGTASFLPKPFSFAQLAREVRQRLDDPRALAAPTR